MSSDRLKTKAQKIRTGKEQIIVNLEKLDADRTALISDGGSTSLAPLRKKYHHRMRKGIHRENLISLNGEINENNYDEELSRKIDAATFLKESEK